MINLEIAEILEKMAEILEIRGKESDKFRVISYLKAAFSLRSLPEEIDKKSSEEDLRKIPGVGEGISLKILEYIQTGKIKEFEKLREKYGDDLLLLLKIPSLGPKTLKMLWRKFAIKNLADLEKFLAEKKYSGLKGFGEKKALNIREGISMLKKNEERVLLGLVYPVVEELIAEMKKCPAVLEISPAGSFRRGKETIGDIDILACGKNPSAIIDCFTNLPQVTKILAKGDSKASVRISSLKRQVDLRAVKIGEFGSALQYFTGSKNHNIALRLIAKEKGYKISEYGIFKGKKLLGSTEEAIYSTLKMQLPPPEIREDLGEIELALKHKIPSLVSEKDILGDLHIHSNYSDGQSSLDEMIEAALAKGYKYLALTDHSISARIAGGLSADDLFSRNREIIALRQKYPIKILLGAEVDILKDGRLDYPDEVLSTLDVVIASIHSGFKPENTERIIKAIQNPHVKIIAHPTGRLLGGREPYPLNLEAVISEAKKMNKALEINSHYKRLDLKDTHARLAMKKGALISINTDSHNKNSLWMMKLGILTARRGFVTKKNVINCLPFAKLYKWLWEGRK